MFSGRKASAKSPDPNFSFEANASSILFSILCHSSMEVKTQGQRQVKEQGLRIVSEGKKNLPQNVVYRVKKA